MSLHSEQSCSICDYYDESNSKVKGTGVCRRQPPTVVLIPSAGPILAGGRQATKLTATSFYPPVDSKDRGCGKHTLNHDVYDITAPPG